MSIELNNVFLSNINDISNEVNRIVSSVYNQLKSIKKGLVSFFFGYPTLIVDREQLNFHIRQEYNQLL